jgi:hypothetical protein
MSLIEFLQIPLKYNQMLSYKNLVGCHSQGFIEPDAQMRFPLIKVTKATCGYGILQDQVVVAIVEDEKNPKVSIHSTLGKYYVRPNRGIAAWFPSNFILTND